MDLDEHRNRLIGYIEEDDVVLLNGEIVKALQNFNVYRLSENLYREVEDAGFTDDHVNVRTYLSWLNAKGVISFLTASEAGLVSNLIHYRTYPFVPSYKDILWVVRVLKQRLEALDPREVFLLGVYREMEIENHDVNEITLSRDMARIKPLLQILQSEYQKHVGIHINSSAKEAADEPRENRIPSA